MKCEVCGGIFKKTLYQKNRSKHHFCSHECFGVSQKNRIEMKCQICNKIINKKPSDIKGHNHSFCSYKCMGIWQSKSGMMKGKNNPTWKGGEIKRNCLLCNKEFSIKQYRKKTGKFCSLKCQNFWLIKNGKKKDTLIEIAIENELKARHIPYDKQVPIVIAHTVVDFLLPNKIIIYCDGDYWHNKPKVKKRDINQDLVLMFNGYKVFRFTGIEINKSAKRCINKIIKGGLNQ
jgi:very-short-patch-repair endonuclease/endogenous inhibitor of DNA gyrase (YacG/DUF329 family)